MYIFRIEVNNYRSLKNVVIGDLSSLVILYGQNDSGKSNILFFLEHVFSEKLNTDVVDLDNASNLRRPGVFWRGELENFSDNFYRNTREPITFHIFVRFLRQEILAISSLPQAFIDSLSAADAFDQLDFRGEISLNNSGRAEIFLLDAFFNQKLFYKVEDDQPQYLPDFDYGPGPSIDIFNKIMGKLNNSFLRVPADRFVSTEKEFDRINKAELTPNTFKNWLLQLSLDRDLEMTFRKISEQFSAAPFSHGKVSLARVNNDEIEAFIDIDKEGYKLPIGRKGSGVQQTLMILSYIAQSRSSLIGIEEIEINLSPATQSAVFNTLLQLVNTNPSPVNQIFLTTHSPRIAKRNEAERRGVWMDHGATIVKKPGEADIDDFFSH